MAYFSPQDPLYPHLIYLIDEAKDSIYAAFYKIELKKLSRALLQAHQRGVKVKIFTDDLTSQDKDSQFPCLAKFGLMLGGQVLNFEFHSWSRTVEEKWFWYAWSENHKWARLPHG